jgi:hypothetical protein
MRAITSPTATFCLSLTVINEPTWNVMLTE